MKHIRPLITLLILFACFVSGAWPQALSKFHSTSQKAVCGSPRRVFTTPKGDDTKDVAITPDGDVLTAEMHSGKIYRVKPNRSVEVIARLFPPGQYPNLNCLGVLLGSDGDLYVLANTFVAPSHGCGAFTKTAHSSSMPPFLRTGRI